MDYQDNEDEDEDDDDDDADMEDVAFHMPSEATRITKMDVDNSVRDQSRTLTNAEAAQSKRNQQKIMTGASHVLYRNGRDAETKGANASQM